MRSRLFFLAMGPVLLLACSKDPPPSQYPQQQGYPQQGYPQQQQPYPQQQQPQYPQQPAPQPMPQQPATQPGAQPGAATGTPTAIPGVTKLANGQCSITPPSLGGAPAQPLVGPCPPGI